MPSALKAMPFKPIARARAHSFIIEPVDFSSNW